MNDRLMNCLANPLMCKIFFYIHQEKAVTAKQLAEVFPKAAQTTLYRYLKSMNKDGLIKVIQEKPVRGTIERTYSLAVNFEENIENIFSSNDGEAYLMLFMQYISSFESAFRAYSKRNNIDLKKDISSFTMAPIFATDDEIITAMTKIGEIMAGLFENKPSIERKPRNIGLIVTPPLNNEETAE